MRLNRFSAAALHLALSVAIAAIIFAIVYFLWYPGDLFESAGGRQIFFLIVGVDVTLGPLITLIVFRRGKPGLRFDLSVIAILQAAALAGGVWVLAESRPVYIVFVIDRFELMHANDYPEEELRRSGSSAYLPFAWGRPRVGGAVMPRDPKERERILFLGPRGVDLQHMPEHYVDYDNVRSEVKAHVKTMAELRHLNPEESKRIDEVIAGTGRSESQIGFVPMRAGDYDLAVIVDRATADILRIARLNPWGK